MRKILIIIMLLLSSVLMADSYVETDTDSPDFGLSVPVKYKVDFSSLEYLEANFTTSEYNYKEDGTTPDYAPLESSMTFDPDTGTAKSDVWIYWIFATENKVYVSLSAADLVSENGNSIPLTIKINSEEPLRAAAQMPIFSLEEHTGTFMLDSGTAQIFLETANMETGFPAELYKTTLTLSIKTEG